MTTWAILAAERRAAFSANANRANSADRSKPSWSAPPTGTIGNNGTGMETLGGSMPAPAAEANGAIGTNGTGKVAIAAELGRAVRPGLPDPVDILERAAILEFCEGLSRAEADARALAEVGLSRAALTLLAEREDQSEARALTLQLQYKSLEA